ncbi:hypothetical protein RSOLAG1IB_10561 [Rhizoctonia solani AG-1 IB]|uniref:Uncharacterized protein n=1 Tax=Thanatephorus cucumeris (strain AG1-IB / isolate 7/3/14) TaxID=1108050 RepID=A0A0B7G319_THACB|nr:hypothetical protein RSOLAG1IB_10561 [Rhizoctonia solani AG-1 IB]
MYTHISNHPLASLQPSWRHQNAISHKPGKYLLIYKESRVSRRPACPDHPGGVVFTFPRSYKSSGEQGADKLARRPFLRQDLDFLAIAKNPCYVLRSATQLYDTEKVVEVENVTTFGSPDRLVSISFGFDYAHR